MRDQLKRCRLLGVRLVEVPLSLFFLLYRGHYGLEAEARGLGPRSERCEPHDEFPRRVPKLHGVGTPDAKSVRISPRLREVDSWG